MEIELGRKRMGEGEGWKREKKRLGPKEEREITTPCGPHGAPRGRLWDSTSNRGVGTSPLAVQGWVP
jgi:hypothetical protein